MIEGLINFDQDEVSPTIIKVIGVGGGGCNAVKYMYEQGICDVDFVVCNTDRQSLADNPVAWQVQMGEALTHGRGAGNSPSVGEAAANESLEDIRAMLSTNTKMVFVTATMGGGTGTGAAPVIVKMAKEMGILTVAVVTVPSRLDGPERLEQACAGIKRMQEYVDAMIVIDNEKIRSMYGSQTISNAFAKANDVLKIAVKGVAEIITLPGYVNVDYADVETVMTNSGVTVIGAARASGVNRASEVIVNALNSPLLNKSDISGAKNILLNITSGIEDDEITMDEMTEITSYVINEVGDTASVIWGVGMDESLGDSLSVTIIATGFPFEEMNDLFDVDISDVAPPKETIRSGVADYAGMILEESEVLLKPDLSPEQIEELKVTPAFKRRSVKVNEF
ncbi:MAG: cell division protein FtsZ [Odoribacteraceae bacterium]|jgi:cell division protein FtsZ|nr:cell division protein FtsZ [Odoribacteraceae bacterium]